MKTKIKYISKYNKKNYQTFLLRIPKKDEKIIDKLNTVE